MPAVTSSAPSALGLVGLGAAGVCVALALRRHLGAATPVTLDDDAWIAYAHEVRLKRKRAPAQSRFRVTAVVVYTCGSRKLRHVVGHNDEAFNLLNSCCAERAAFLHLASLDEASAASPIEVLAVYITTDAPHAITPGALCREFMITNLLTTDETRVVMQGAGSDAPIITRTLGEL